MIASMLSDSAAQVSTKTTDTGASTTETGEISGNKQINSNITKELVKIGDDIDKHLSETLDN
jgi:hypothetical protein